jgi:putative transport protein
MELAILCIVLFFGYLVGQIQIKRVSLGTSAVLFVALIFGYFEYSLSPILTEFGLVLFMYSVGLLVGPRFFRMFRKTGIHSIIAAAVTALSGAIGVWIVFQWLHIPYDIATGLYCGGLTNTPALAAAMQTAEKQFSMDVAASISSGYGIAYPFGMVSVVIFNQFLPIFIKKDPRQEEEKWKKNTEKMYPPLVAFQCIAENPGIVGKTIQEINPDRRFRTNFSRILRGDTIHIASPSFVIEKDDIIRLVGPASEQDLVEQMIGTKTASWEDKKEQKRVRDARVMESSVIGKRLRELRFFAKHGVIVTRIIRSGFEFAPNGGMVLEMGDIIRMIGDMSSLEEVKKMVQGDTKQLELTDFVPYLLGLLIGVGIGFIPIPIPNHLRITLGASGGVFITALVLGHFGRIGRWRFYVPTSVHNFSMEFGLMIFLAGAGMVAGSRIIPIIAQHGLILFVAGAIVTCTTILITFFVMWKLLKMNIHDMLGSLSGGMTNPPALSAANSQSTMGLPTIAYAGVMPMALIFKILVAQLLLLVLV